MNKIQLKVLKVKNKYSARKVKLNIILWLANGEPYILNTSIETSQVRLTIQDVTMIGNPNNNKPFISVGSANE